MSSLYAFSLNIGRPLAMKFFATHAVWPSTEFIKVSKTSLCFDFDTFCSPSNQPRRPSFGYATLIGGPPASLTRSSTPRLPRPIHADSSLSAVTVSVFWLTSLRMFGFHFLSHALARAISGIVRSYGCFAPVARPPNAIMVSGEFSYTILPLYFGSSRAWYESGFVFTNFGL